MRPFLFLLSLIVFTSCSKSTEAEYITPTVDPFSGLNLPETPFNYANIPLPTHYTQNAFSAQAQFQRAAVDFDNTPANNLITDTGATLGILFMMKSSQWRSFLLAPPAGSWVF